MLWVLHNDLIHSKSLSNPCMQGLWGSCFDESAPSKARPYGLLPPYAYMAFGNRFVMKSVIGLYALETPQF